MGDCVCDGSIDHIIGSAFSIVISCDESPISEAGNPLVNVGAWGVALEAVRSGEVIVVQGVWLDVVGPVWRMKFEQSDTSSWHVGQSEVRIKFTAPDARVFRVETDTVLEIKR